MSFESVKGHNQTHNLIPDWQSFSCYAGPKHEVRNAEVTHCFAGILLQVVDKPLMQLSPDGGHGEFSVILQERGHNVST